MIEEALIWKATDGSQGERERQPGWDSPRRLSTQRSDVWESTTIAISLFRPDFLARGLESGRILLTRQEFLKLQDFHL